MVSRVTAYFKRWRRVPYLYDKFDQFLQEFAAVQRRIDALQEAVGRIENRQLYAGNEDELARTEFRAFSQFGEDGIIQFLVRNVPLDRKIFVEFGADNYNVESNTRFLLTNDNWTGLIIDGSEDAIQSVKRSATYVLYDLRAVTAFITRENINELLASSGITGEIGILSIDVDGNDYWIWEAIDVVNPAIVIVEYNYRFGKELAVTIPYDPAFVRSPPSPSRLYYGASLKALWLLARRKGYAFVGCSRNGVNAFFVRADKRPSSLRELTVEEGFVGGSFGEPFELNGECVKLPPEREMALLDELQLPLVNVEGLLSQS
jgi:hypothetical protein